MYEYKAFIGRVIDGDTVEAEIDLGFTVKVTVRLRLLGIDAPERKGATLAAGNASRDFLKDLVEGKLTTLKSSVVKTRSGLEREAKTFDRYVAELFLPGDPVSANQKMLDAGQAVVYPS